MARDRGAVILKTKLGWSYTKALRFLRESRPDIEQYARDQEITFTSAMVAVAQARDEIEKEQA